MRDLVPGHAAVGGFEQVGDVAFAYAAAWFGTECRAVIGKRPTEGGGDKAKVVDAFVCDVHHSLRPVLAAVACGLEGVDAGVVAGVDPGMIHINKIDVIVVEGSDGPAFPGLAAVVGGIDLRFLRIVRCGTTEARGKEAILRGKKPGASRRNGC